MQFCSVSGSEINKDFAENNFLRAKPALLRTVCTEFYFV
jgi:hypothetical protein